MRCSQPPAPLGRPPGSQAPASFDRSPQRMHPEFLLLWTSQAVGEAGPPGWTAVATTQALILQWVLNAGLTRGPSGPGLSPSTAHCPKRPGRPRAALAELLNGGQEGLLLLLPGDSTRLGTRPEGAGRPPSWGCPSGGEAGTPGPLRCGKSLLPPVPQPPGPGVRPEASPPRPQSLGLLSSAPAVSPSRADRATEMGCPSDWVFLFHGGLTHSSSLSGPLGNVSGVIVQREWSEPCFPRGPGVGGAPRCTLGELRGEMRSTRGCGGH